MSDRTPADVIAAAFSVGRGATNSPEALAARVVDALATTGFRVVPIPDDNTRALAARLDNMAGNGYDPDAHTVLRAAAALLRRQGEQLDTLRAAIGDPDELRRIAVSVARDRKVTSAEAERRIGILTALAAAVPQDPERCACGKPATGTVGGVPTCGDDR